MVSTGRPGADAVAAKGWFPAHKWLVLRRGSQLLILSAFLLGPWAGLWLIKGNLSSSLTLEVLPMTDPYLLLQSLAAGHLPAMSAITGALIVLAIYLLVGGRVYCSWVCPVNIVTDAAAWLRERLDIDKGARLKRQTRYWILALTLLLALVSGSIAWELINPVSMLHRGLIFGMGLAWTIVLLVFLFDLLISHRGWCGHLCPVGAFYSLLGRFSLLRVSARRRSACNDCMDCYAVCPEPQVISPALKGVGKNITPVILSPNCTNCGRCVDICSKDVFGFSMRFNNEMEAVS